MCNLFSDTIKVFTGRDTLEFVGKSTFIASIMVKSIFHIYFMKIHCLLSSLQEQNIFRQDLGIGI
jgi:hypothetical protein